MSRRRTCCCEGVEPGACLSKRDFEVSLRYRATCEHFEKVEVTTQTFQIATDCGGADVPCPLPSLSCTCPQKGGCSSDYTPDSPGECSTPGFTAHYLSSFEMDTWTFTVPYISTSTANVSSQAGCTWVGDPGTGLASSGLSYAGLRETDLNRVTLRYDLSTTGCEGCVTLNPNPSGAFSHVLEVKYLHRCTYSTPPAYMSLQRATSATYLNWTFEIDGGIFKTRNSSGTLQNSLDLTTVTMAAAVTTIDGWPETIATGVGAAAAASWPASMWEDRAAALIPTPFAAPVPIFAAGGLIENYQDGLMGPKWQTQDTNGACLNGPVFPLKLGCTDGPCDYEGGTDEAAELEFCKGIGATFCDYVTSYNPTTGVGENNFQNWCSSVSNFPTGYWGCIDNLLVWQETPCTPTNGWDICLHGFGDRAMVAATPFLICSDDTGAWDPTYCSTSSFINECDFCDCGPDFGTSCVKTSERQGWALSKYFSVTRL